MCLVVIAFDAHVLKWTLDNNPPDEYVRHHIREASFYNTDEWSIDLVLKLDSSRGDDDRLRVDFIGLEEQGMWPAKKERVRAEERGEALRLFEEFDAWLEARTRGAADALLMGTVAGVVSI